MSLKVLGSSPLMFERYVTRPSSITDVVLGMGSLLEFYAELVLEVVVLVDGPIPSSPAPVLASSM
jgi:hypothetical protein